MLGICDSHFIVCVSLRKLFTLPQGPSWTDILKNSSIPFNVVQKFLFLLTVSSGRKTVTHAALGTTQQRTAGLTENTDENSAENTLKATARNQPLLPVDADMSNRSLSQGPKKQTSGFVPGKNWISFNKAFSLKKGTFLHLKFNLIVFWCLAKREKKSNVNKYKRNL